MTALNTILALVSHPKQAKPGAWMAGCPCCRSRKGTPLAITDTGDGRVLLNAFCGCSTEAVLDALGLKFSDLFDQPLATHMEPTRTLVSARDLLTVLSEEISVIAILAAQAVDKHDLSEDDWNRLAKAANRVWAARDHINGA